MVRTQQGAYNLGNFGVLVICENVTQTLFFPKAVRNIDPNFPVSANFKRSLKDFFAERKQMKIFLQTGR